MATTAENLNIIASVKSEIKGIIATDSNHLEAYPNKIAECIVDAPSVQSWADTRTTADGGTIKDGIAYVKALRGKSIKYNNLMKSAPVTTASGGCDITYEDRVLSFKGTSTTTYSAFLAYYILEYVKANLAHKYLIVARVLKNVGNVSFAFGWTNRNKAITGITSGVNTLLYSFADSDLTKGSYLGISQYASGTAIDIELELSLLDLTEMGIDSLTTADAVAQYLGYASASAFGSLPISADTKILNCKQKSVISKTMWKSVDMGSLNWAYRSGVWKSFPTFYVNLVDCLKVSKTEIAQASCDLYETIAYVDLSETSAGMAYAAQNTNLVISDPSVTTLEAFKAKVTGHMLTYASTTYTTLDTLTLPTMTAFPNGLCGVGTAYDEVSLAEGKATKRIGCVKLKDLNWFYSSSSAVFFATMADATLTRGAALTTNAAYLNSGYTTLSDMANKTYQCFAPNTLYIKDATYTDAASFKAHFTDSDVLYYPLATATESTFTPCRAYYKASNNGQETATADTATAPFTAEIGYKEPTATELANALNA